MEEISIPQELTTYCLTKEFLNYLPKQLKMGEVINPQYIEYDEEGKLSEVAESCYKKVQLYTNGRFDVKDYIKSLPKNGEELIKLCDKSPYGDLKTQTTIFDDKVRKAYEISGDKIELTNKLIQKLENIKYQISCNLFNYKKIHFELNKLNVYSEGCHFSTHVDTPKENMIGTLVVVLPDYKYEGGELEIDCNSNDKINKNGWIAFYADLPHRIMPVTKGYRVSLTFYIMKSDEDEEYNTFDKQEMPKDIIESGDIIMGMVKDKFGLLLSHKYSYSEYKNGIYKGYDGIMLDYLLKRCNLLEGYPVIVSHSETCDYDHNYDVEQSVYRFTEDDIKHDSEYEPLEYTDIDFFSLGTPYIELDKEEQYYIEHTGNESQDGFINGKYFQFAVILAKI